MTVTRVPANNPEPEYEIDWEAPVKRTLCLALSDDRNMPLQCRFKVDHATRHEWEIDSSPLTEGRAERLREEQDTPSGRLPVRTPGAALEEAREVMDDFQRAMDDFQMEPSAENLAATREVIETWPA